jgi:hypothetical protein
MKEPREQKVALRGRALAQHRMALENTLLQPLEGTLTFVSKKKGVFVYRNPKTGDMEAISIKFDK